MEDGSRRGFQRAQPLAVASHVVADGATLRLAREPGGAEG